MSLWLLHKNVFLPPRNCLPAHRPLWTDIHPTNIISQWRDEWKSAPVVKSSLVDDSTNLATRIRYTQMLLGAPESLPDQPRPLDILSKEVGPRSNRHVPLWQMPNDVTYCQHLSTVQAGGGGCSDCTQLMTLVSNGWRQQQHSTTTTTAIFQLGYSCVHIVGTQNFFFWIYKRNFLREER